MLPDCEPAAVGANVTSIMQLAFGCNVCPFMQVEPVSAKTPGVTVKVDSISGVAPVLVSVTVFMLVLERITVPKFRL